ncbi:MAG: lipid IV(A) 3-deoxy-D-manno-octulosonic acid transferase [Candidatus Marinarcus sp.]|uniref:lipid IV(A) 3-deoxy-D-manno-octulosonic acid transferase n=1 Tax=Candidatus Marinarcus sp. TaxID=3100987 RepID=UPI003B00680A
MSLFSFFYYILSLLVYLLALPYLIYKSKSLKYSIAIPAKFFLKNNPCFEKSAVWFHCCSFGEIKAIKPIIDELNEEVNISVMTNTGFEEARKLSSNVRYLPYELFLPFWISKQKALLVMEAELWYMLFLVAKAKGIKTYLINARISDRSYASYMRFAFLYKRVFQHIDKVYAQSALDKERLENLGAHHVEIIGNIKLAQRPKITKKLDKPDGFIITAGSTHEKEEALILDAYEKTLGKLIIVPRHPERFDKVDVLIQNYIKNKALTYHRYSQQEDFKSDIILVDKMGELNNIYAISDCVILGGAFEKVGGHNPIEPAFFQCRIISGEHIFNQKPLFASVSHYTLTSNENLKSVLHNVQQLEKSNLIDIGTIEPIIKEIHGI